MATEEHKQTLLKELDTIDQSSFFCVQLISSAFPEMKDDYYALMQINDLVLRMKERAVGLQTN